MVIGYNLRVVWSKRLYQEKEAEIDRQEAETGMETVPMTRAAALFAMIYPGKEETKSISLSNGRKLGCRVFSETSYTVGTYRQGPLYEWFYLVPTVVDGKVTDVTAVDRERNPDSDRQKEWEAYVDYIITLLPESKRKKLELLMK